MLLRPASGEYSPRRCVRRLPEKARIEQPLHCRDGKESGTVSGEPRSKGEGGKGPDMRVTVAGVEFRSPAIAASGTFGYGVEFEDVVSLDRIGGVVRKGGSRGPKRGRALPGRS